MSGDGERCFVYALQADGVARRSSSARRRRAFAKLDEISPTSTSGGRPATNRADLPRDEKVVMGTSGGRAARLRDQECRHPALLRGESDLARPPSLPTEAPNAEAAVEFLRGTPPTRKRERSGSRRWATVGHPERMPTSRPKFRRLAAPPRHGQGCHTRRRVVTTEPGGSLPRWTSG